MTTDADSPAAQDAGDIPSFDGLLGVLVRTMNALPGSEIGVTLHVSGVIISGQIIAMSDYFAGLAAEIAGASGSPDSAAGRAAFAEIFAKLAADSRPAPDTDPTGQPDPDFIHLRDARVISPNTGRAALPPGLWRGRLSHVSAWSLGTPSGQ
jgi:hypothetical protein